MENKKNIKVGDYMRWLYPLGYVDQSARKFSYGLVMEIKEEDTLDGKIALLLDTGYKQTFWLSIELLIELGDAEILKDGDWQRLQ
jgi:hypothetical protein|tara:strand:+ start:446 stop:700 length:255 start_codon:yes stop_codon:yes gene_type:complete